MKRCTGIAAVAITFACASGESAEPQYTIAVNSFRPIDTDIFITADVGEKPRPFLPHAALDYNASFSPDGSWIVFTSERGGSADVYRARPDGSGLER